jgi:hypothetical protein
VTFTPNDTKDYNSTTATVKITVEQATPKLSWAAPAAIIYGTPLGTTQLDAKATIPGTFKYSPAPGTILTVGSGQLLTVDFAPTDSRDYTHGSAAARITVTKATPKITWADPAAIVYGTPLGAAQLDAVATFGSSVVMGTYSYAPQVGSVLHVGSNQMLRVTFTPKDGVDFNSVSAAVLITVTPASSGKTTYTPAAGAVLPAGSNQTLSAIPTVSTDDGQANATALIRVTMPPVAASTPENPGESTTNVITPPAFNPGAVRLASFAAGGPVPEATPVATPLDRTGQDVVSITGSGRTPPAQDLTDDIWLKALEDLFHGDE